MQSSSVVLASQPASQSTYSTRLDLAVGAQTNRDMRLIGEERRKFRVVKRREKEREGRMDKRHGTRPK